MIAAAMIDGLRLRSTRQPAGSTDAGVAPRRPSLNVLTFTAADFSSPSQAEAALAQARDHLVAQGSGTSREPRAVVIGRSGPEGFPVSVSVDATGIFADFGGLLTEFESVETAINAVRWALSAASRLRITLVDGRPCAWVLETTCASGGETILAMDHPVPLRRFRRISCLTRQNRHLAGDALDVGPAIPTAIANSVL